MGKKFSIKSNPTFPAKVKWPVVGGDPVEIDFTFNYLGREALAEYQAKKTEYSKSLLELAKNESSNSEIANKAISYEFEFLKTIIAGWGVDEEYNDENLRIAVSEGTHITHAIEDAFFAAYDKARQGN